MKKVNFYFDFISPYTYLASTQLAALSTEYGVIFEWLPVNLPKLMKQAGNVSPVSIKSKAIYSLRDLKRWAAYLDVPFKLIRPGSFDSRPALRIAGALQGEDRSVFCMAVFEALWSGSVDPTRDDWLVTLFEKARLPKAWLALASGDLEQYTEKALKAGVFGVPTFILHGKGRPEMFFGIDHMDFLARACESSGSIAAT